MHRLLATAAGLILAALPSFAVQAAGPTTVVAGSVAPNALLSIDQNRTTVVERIMATWGDALIASDAGVARDQLRALLTGLRSDQLLAASFAGSLEGLRNVIANALTASVPVSSGLLQAKALGDANADLVYTPVLPCRLADTRSAGGQITGGASRDFKVWVASGGFAAQGGDAGNCAIPSNPTAVVLNLTAVNPPGSGNLIAYPAGGTAPNTSALNYQSGIGALANGAIIPACTPNCTSQITLKTNGAGADVVIDIVGYFKPPAGGYVASVGAGTGISVGGTATSPTVAIANGYQLPQACANGQVAQSNGAGGWTCASAVGSGTVTSVATGTGLSGGPITTTGTIAADTAYLQRRVSGLCAAGLYISAIAADGTVTCAVDANSGGTVTSVNTGTGLSGGPITSTGTINLATTQLLPTVACTSNQIPKWTGSAWACAADSDSASGGLAGQVLIGTGAAPAWSGSPSLSGNLALVETTSASTGVITKGGNRFIHNFGGTNTFIGEFAGNFTMTGVANTASGYLALVNNTTGAQNTASGQDALLNNSTGAQNTASGFFALSSNTFGGQNTAIGSGALAGNTTGIGNTAIGNQADVASNNLTNATAIGNTAVVNASNKIRLGNGAVTVIEGQVAYTFTSDRTKKENIRRVEAQEVLERLRGIDVTSWNYIGQDAGEFRHYGPMAQDFFAAFGHDGVGMVGTDTTINSGDMTGILMLGLKGLDMTVQEDQRTIAAQAVEIATLKHQNERIALLEQQVAQLVALQAQSARVAAAVE